jgi:hypothetical protein
VIKVPYMAPGHWASGYTYVCLSGDTSICTKFRIGWYLDTDSRCRGDTIYQSSDASGNTFCQIELPGP